MFLGLDLSLTGTGVSLGDTLLTLAPKKLSGAERLDWFDVTIGELLEGNYVTGVAVEGYSYGSKNSQSHKLGELGGVIRMRLWRAKVPFLIAAPTVVKKFATGNGGASKELVMLNVYKRWGVEAGDNNQADAFVLARIAEAHYGAGQDLTAFQRDALTGVEEVLPLRERPAVRVRTRATGFKKT